MKLLQTQRCLLLGRHPLKHHHMKQLRWVLSTQRGKYNENADSLPSNQRCLSSASPRKKKPVLVILGSGWGSYSVLKHVNKQLYDVVVVSPRNYFLFTPLLSSTTVGTLEFRSIIEPIRGNNECTFHLAKAKEIDFDNNKVVCQSVARAGLEYSLPYDKLVVGVGATTNTFKIPGVEENTFFIKEIEHARKIRNKLISNLELASEPGINRQERKRLLHTVIVGAGPTGVEVGAELNDFIRTDVSIKYPEIKHDLEVTFIEAEKILSSFPSTLRRWAEKKINSRKGFTIVKDFVVEVTPNSVKLSDGTELPCGLVVWSTGLQPLKFTNSLKCLKREQTGQIYTNEYLRIKNEITKEPIKSVFALGDCAEIEGLPLPSTAQVAERQGQFLAKFLNDICNDPKQECKQKPFNFESMGMLAYVGGYSALYGNEPSQNQKGLSDWLKSKLNLKGKMAWLMWRTAYMTKLGSWPKRFQVPFDWAKTFFFGRDVSRLQE